MYAHKYIPDEYAMAMQSGPEEDDVEHKPMVTPQVSLKEGLKVCGADGSAAVTKDMQKLHDLTVMKPCKGKELTWEQKHVASAYLIFIK